MLAMRHRFVYKIVAVLQIRYVIYKRIGAKEGFMKKLTTLILAAGLMLSMTQPVFAIDFKAKGQWIMSFDYGSGMSGYSDSRSGGRVYGSGYGKPSEDDFEARQRVRLQLDAIASESLSGTVYFEIGNSVWGNVDDGAGLGADGTIVELKRAYIDWVVPDTSVQVRMGIQGLALPSFPAGTGGSQVFNADVAGIVISNKFNDFITATMFWGRPYNDNYINETADTYGGHSSNMLDNVDLFGLVVPMTFDGVKVVPWVTYAAVGQNFARYGTNDDYDMGGDFTNMATGLLPIGMASAMINNNVDNDLFPYGNVINAGITGEITTWSPFRMAWDFNYGDADFGADYLKRQGFFASMLFEYKLDWAIPGLYGWYSSGDDDDLDNGSERMPTMDTNNGDIDFSHLAFSGNPYIARENIIGNTLIGTWGVGLRLKDFSFIEDLKHTLRVNYIQGTNSTEMAQYLRGTKNFSDNGTNFSPSDNRSAAFKTDAGIYMTTADSAVEVGFSNTYKMYENFEIMVDAAYLALWMSQDGDVWGNGFEATDAWNVNASFVYSF